MEKIRNQALRILSRREHSTLELKEKLTKTYPDKQDNIQTVIVEFKENDWVSDSRFCEAFIKDQIIGKQGPRKIEQKLFQKGIDKALMQESIAEFYPDKTQIPIAQYLGLKKKDELLRKKPKIMEFELNGKVSQFLIGRGFGYDLLKQLDL